MDGYLRGCLALARSERPIVVLDTETTGLLVPGAHFPFVWEIGARKRLPDGSVEVFSAMLDWGVSIPPAANLADTDPDLPITAGLEPSFVLGQFAAFIAGCVLVGQRVETFDLPVLRAAYEAVGLGVPRQIYIPGYTIDTRVIAEMLWAHAPVGSDRPDDFHLPDLGRFLGASFDSIHRAMADVGLNEQVFDALMDILERQDAIEHPIE